MAHEVGHFIDGIHSFSIKIIPKCKEYALKRAEGQLTSPKSRKMAIDIIEAWIPEIIADIVGVSILGPAYVFALDDISHIPPTLYTMLSQSHPPFSLRAKHTSSYCQRYLINPMLNQNDGTSFTDDENQAINCLQSWFLFLSNQRQRRFVFSGSDLPYADQKVIYGIGKKAIEQAVKLIHYEIQKVGNESWICSSDDIYDAIKLQIFLSNRLPPSELPYTNGKTPSFAAIMNSGWIFCLCRENDYSYFEGNLLSLEPKLVFERYTKDQNLVAKAVENYLFRNEYIRRKGRADD